MPKEAKITASPRHNMPSQEARESRVKRAKKIKHNCFKLVLNILSQSMRIFFVKENISPMN
jgi:hypothetical protein